MKSYRLAQLASEGALLLADTPMPKRFPEDLRTWSSSTALLQMAQGVAQEHTATSLRPVFSFTARRFHHPWRMLALLTYGLGSGIWHSRALAEIAALDPELSALCHGETPSTEIIRQFREQNRKAIVHCLELLLRRVWLHRYGQRAMGAHAFLMVEIVSEARKRLQRSEASELDEDSERPTNE